jgi:hypothetical protein
VVVAITYPPEQVEVQTAGRQTVPLANPIRLRRGQILNVTADKVPAPDDATGGWAPPINRDPSVLRLERITNADRSLRVSFKAIAFGSDQLLIRRPCSRGACAAAYLEVVLTVRP